MNRPALGIGRLALVLAMAPIGCGPTGVETQYGRSRGASINGTRALAELLRQRGHEVRAAVRLTDPLAAWADVLVRFAPYPGPPDRDESAWMLGWLHSAPGRKVVYVPRDFDAAPEFWERMIADFPKGGDPATLRRLERHRDLSKAWAGDLPPRSRTPARAEDWFPAAANPGPPTTCRTLQGPWADGVDARAAAVASHATFRAEQGETVLLDGDGSTLAMTWTLPGESAVLAVANASFLLNAALLNRARRPLALRVVDWVGPGPRRVAFVEGTSLLADGDAPSGSPLRLLGVAPFGWVAAHLGAFGLLFCLALAATLGRPRPEAPSGVERPSAHPEALGALMARTGRADVARALLDAYRSWRHPVPVEGRPAPTSPRRRPRA